MSRLTLIVVLALLLGGCAGPAPSPSSADPGRAAVLQPTAIALVEGMEAGSFDPVAAAFDPKLAGQVTSSGLKDAFTKTVEPLGAYQSITGAYTVRVNGSDVVYVVAKHATASLRVLMSFDSSDRVNGLYFAQATPEEIAKASGTVATYPPTGQHALDTAVSVGTYALPGVLSVPAGGQKLPIVVVMLSGSGPNDRDETIGKAGNKPFRDIADALAAHGISTLRFDKSTRAAADRLPTPITLAAEYFDDAKAAIDLARARPELAGYAIYVLGHSEGAMVMPRVLADNPGVAGGISLAGSPRSLFDIMYDQNVAVVNASTASDAEKQAALAHARQVMDDAKAMTDPNGTPPAELAGVMSAAYIVGLNNLRQADAAQALTVPLLFLQGEADFQVSMTADFGGWKSLLDGRPSVTFASFPGLNHLFMPTQGLATTADYDAPATVDPAVTDAIAAWLAKGP